MVGYRVKFFVIEKKINIPGTPYFSMGRFDAITDPP